MFTLVRSGDLVLVQSALLAELPVLHAITTRMGGVSRAPYDGLNMAFHVGDDPTAVCENRRQVSTALGLPPTALVAGEQVHGCSCHVATTTDMGRGALEKDTAIPSTDILVTQTPGLLLASFYADCVPVLLADPVHHAVGVAHCGWRGTLALAPQVALATMQNTFGTKPQDVRAVVGPGIGPCCYEVSTQIADHFRTRFGSDIALGRQLDLRLANVRTLQETGVPQEAIHVAPWCTSCQHDLFFSYRASGGQTGRIAVLVGLPK